ncbi:UDP-N-acetylmuramate:L-alanyl-gamma-D-glutamyl-meso-diaminopimelate ligase [bacterium]|nr:UDP-N-acetylmuramate:L-alanyl-gamma-D-glutamyl-meso-diaminopimelate ligase [bacterium]
MNNTLGQKIHFSGIGGLAMLSGARLAKAAGWEVRGSDNPLYPPASEMLKKLDVQLYEGYKASNLDWNPDIVVIGNALSRGNEEVEAVLSRRFKYVSLPEWLKNDVLQHRKPVVITGTHGKTSTTTLTAHLLNECGLNPGYLIGGQPLNLESSSKLGDIGAPFVIEGDEYDTAFFDKRAKFFHYLPHIAVVTSIEFDHGDIYPDLESIRKAFALMLRQLPREGWLLACQDNEEARDLTEKAYSNVATYGFGQRADWRGRIVGGSPGIQHVIVERYGKFWGEFDIPLVGRHNIQNAIAAIAVAGTLEVEPEAIAQAMRSYRGVRRRMEVFLKAKGMTFIDDFAHHPTAIRETILAVKEGYGGRVIVLLEPRSNTMVTNRFQKEIEGALSVADRIYFGPIYRADRYKEDELLDRNEIVRNLTKKGIPSFCFDNFHELEEEVIKSGLEGDVFLILSNGAFGGIHKRFKERLGG